MSLINEALKRAKAAQQNAPAPPEPSLQLRPVEPASTVRHGVGLAIPIALAVVALLILFFVWQYAPRATTGPDAGTPEVRARAEAPQELVQSSGSPATATKSSVAEPEPVQAGNVRPAARAETKSPPPTTVAGVEPSSSTIVPGAGATATQPTTKQPLANVEAAAAPAGTNLSSDVIPPKPPLPKLQGIVLDPKRPSAVLSGKTIFVGERIGGLRLVAVRRDSATLVGGGQTNVLSLEEY